MGGASNIGEVVYNVFHFQPWGTPVAIYLLTKGIAGGIFLVTLLATWLGAGSTDNKLFRRVAPIVSLVFMAITGVLLIEDLERPERFYFLFTHTNWGSVLGIGAWILNLFGLAAVIYYVADFYKDDLVRAITMWIAALAGLFVTGYTGFLMYQAAGRMLWHNHFLPIELVLHAIVAGAAVLLLAGVFTKADNGTLRALTTVLLGSSVVNLAFAITEAGSFVEAGMSSGLVWGLGVAAGTVLPIVLLVAGLKGSSSASASAGLAAGGAGGATVVTNSASVNTGLVTVAAILALVGLFALEYALVHAGMRIPLS